MTAIGSGGHRGKRSRLSTAMWLAVVLPLFCATAAPGAAALEIRGVVSAVEPDDAVSITLPAGSVVAAGDVVRIEVDLAGIGPIAIETRWRITSSEPGIAHADPVSPASGEPQVGYIAVIETTAPPQASTLPAGDGVPVGMCDQLASAADDPGAVSPGVARQALVRNAAAAVAACSEAVTANPNVSRLQLQLARALLAAGDDTQAEHRMRAAADRGNIAAMSRLGTMLCSVCDAAPSVTKDDAEAARWFRRAAEAGHAAAMRNLARAYHRGLGVGADPHEALHWYQRAVDAGDVPSMTNLGALYVMGEVVEKDLARAADLYQRAADLGEPMAMFNLAMMYRHGASVEQNDVAATALFVKAAEAGNPRAALQAARALDRGEGITRDPDAAARYVIVALRGGFADARAALVSQADMWSRDFRRACQRALRDLGLYDGAIDGVFGRGTRRAIDELAGG